MDSDGDVTGPINLGNPAEFTVAALAELVIELTGSQSAITNRPLPQDDPRRRRPDISLARTKLGWEPRTGPREGLLHTIRYFDQLLSAGEAVNGKSATATTSRGLGLSDASRP